MRREVLVLASALMLLPVVACASPTNTPIKPIIIPDSGSVLAASEQIPSASANARIFAATNILADYNPDTGWPTNQGNLALQAEDLFPKEMVKTYGIENLDRSVAVRLWQDPKSTTWMVLKTDSTVSAAQLRSDLNVNLAKIMPPLTQGSTPNYNTLFTNLTTKTFAGVEAGTLVRIAQKVPFTNGVQHDLTSLPPSVQEYLLNEFLARTGGKMMLKTADATGIIPAGKIAAVFDVSQMTKANNTVITLMRPPEVSYSFSARLSSNLNEEALATFIRNASEPIMVPGGVAGSAKNYFVEVKGSLPAMNPKYLSIVRGDGQQMVAMDGLDVYEASNINYGTVGGARRNWVESLGRMIDRDPALASKFGIEPVSAEAESALLESSAGTKLSAMFSKQWLRGEGGSMMAGANMLAIIVQLSAPELVKAYQINYENATLAGKLDIINADREASYLQTQCVPGMNAYAVVPMETIPRNRPIYEYLTPLIQTSTGEICDAFRLGIKAPSNGSQYPLGTYLLKFREDIQTFNNDWIAVVLEDGKAPRFVNKGEKEIPIFPSSILSKIPTIVMFADGQKISIQQGYPRDMKIPSNKYINRDKPSIIFKTVEFVL